MEGLFSKRHAKSLKAGDIPRPSFARPLRRRLAMICSEYNEETRFYDGYTDTECKAVTALKMAYGSDELRVQGYERGADRNATGFGDFVVYCLPEHVLDALESFYRLLSDDNKRPYQLRVNAILEEEDSQWCLFDGRMFMVDSRFLHTLRNETEEQMKLEGFMGAHEEFRDARSYLQAGDADVAIQKANCAYESALKSLLNQREGSANDLLKRLREETDLFRGVPDDAQIAMVSKVLQALPALRHKLAGHGQGPEPINVPRAYGDLALNLAATYIKFLLDLKKDLMVEPQASATLDEEDIPF